MTGGQNMCFTHSATNAINTRIDSVFFLNLYTTLMDVRLEPSWKQALSDQLDAPYFKRLAERVRFAYETETIYPHPKYVFRALELTPLSTVRVVILGQDPYHGPHQAHGLAFSVQSGVAIPPSLKNIYKEITTDIGTLVHDTGDLTAWATQGVLLLNSTLTVQAGEAGSHQGLGWEEFTDEIIKTVAHERTQVVFLLWGAYAIAKRRLIDESQHLVLTAPHPSPLSAHRGFFGCRHFSTCNEYLQHHGTTPVVW
jgi:uracil-DNA glycosylase